MHWKQASQHHRPSPSPRKRTASQCLILLKSLSPKLTRHVRNTASQYHLTMSVNLYYIVIETHSIPAFLESLCAIQHHIVIETLYIPFPLCLPTHIITVLRQPIITHSIPTLAFSIVTICISSQSHPISPERQIEQNAYRLPYCSRTNSISP